MKPTAKAPLHTAKCSLCDVVYGPCTLTELTAQHGVHARAMHKTARVVAVKDLRLVKESK